MLDAELRFQAFQNRKYLGKMRARRDWIATGALDNPFLGGEPEAEGYAREAHTILREQEISASINVEEG